ncbi:DUF1801 domain-containing protein [Paraneptunicella aestuarii]|uniref:DUF1801 domain-containing protein n=1 Tax=Paraneptunicella aestuarii TaxID=2831148 RepID=UPI001E284229|nr:DUF1801 domain-containing protein [Paraneptunicella aestuarii]UAA38273.1 DUF1801 domain-containing protein [Paraneptunicella aestuarii]
MNFDVAAKFDSYPDDVRPKLEYLRQLIFSVAQEIGADEVEESLKWGEPSYQVKGGSAVRFDWKAKSPDQYALYFNCQSSLVETFREIYGEQFQFQGNRALVLGINDTVLELPLKHCLKLAMTYHKIKHLPLLGA